MSDKNLDPHAEAVAAMYLYGSEYAKSRLGCMDFYDRLPRSLKRLCADLVDDVLARKQRAPSLPTEVEP